MRPLKRALRETDRNRTPLSIPPVSLLSPAGGVLRDPPYAPWEADLGLNDIAATLTLSPRHASFVRRVLAGLNTDPAVIAWRQAVLSDLLDRPTLVEQLRALLPRLADLASGNTQFGGRKRLLLLEVSDRLAQLDLYTGVVHDLHTTLAAADIRSEALRRLRDNLRSLLDNESFQELQRELPALQRPLSNLASLVIGINLDAQLRPASAVLLGINDTPIGEPASLLDRLIGKRQDAQDETGIAPLHYVPENAEMRPMSQLFQDMDRIVTDVAKPVARALERYVRVSYAPLVGLEPELAFFVAAVDMIQRGRARGIPFCQPDIAPMTDRVLDISGLVNSALANRSAVTPVPSDARFGPDGRIAILTGPNSGGKTTYVQAVGQAQVMAQAGLFVAAQSARISPVDAILTHFPALETRQQGRLAEEAERLRDIFRQATRHSLVLLNESLSSTAFGEALFLAQDVLAGLRAIGARAIFATHLVELVGRISEIEAAVPGDCHLYSLVAGIQIDENATARPTYKISRDQPLGRSFAQEIARRHGISLDQILAARRENTSSEP